MKEEARSWVIEVLGARDAREIRSLAFGITSDLRLIEVDDRLLVLRRYETHEVLDLIPRLVEYEARALTAARRVLRELVPEPIAFDVTGVRAGRPSLLMTFLPGAPVIHGLAPAQLALPLAQLHGSPLQGDLPRYHHWFDAERVVVPTWTTRPDAWSKLVDVVRGREPDAPHVFLHRDFHPGNLLWHQGELTGIVDWAFSCHGPRGVDVAHTRGNLALVDGVIAADRFLGAYRDLVPTYEHHPWWDIADLLSGGDQFFGVMAFNAFGADLDVDLLASRADDWAEALADAV